MDIVEFVHILDHSIIYVLGELTNLHMNCLGFLCIKHFLFTCALCYRYEYNMIVLLYTVRRHCLMKASFCNLDIVLSVNYYYCTL